MQTLTWRWRLIAAVAITARWVLRWRVDVRGLGHVPRRSGAVLAFNHHSYLDYVTVAWPVVRQLKRPVRFLAKREIWSSRWLGWIVRWGEAVPVDRSSPTGRSEAFDAAASALRHGDLVAVAPEQTISPSYELLPIRAGAVRMAQQAGVPIVPVAGWGTQRALPKGGRKHAAVGLPVTVCFGPPLQVDADEDVSEATGRLERAMTALLHHVQETYPDGAPAGAPWVPARLGGGAPPHDEALAAIEARRRRWEGPADGGGERPSPTEQ